MEGTEKNIGNLESQNCASKSEPTLDSAIIEADYNAATGTRPYSMGKNLTKLRREWRDFVECKLLADSSKDDLILIIFKHYKDLVKEYELQPSFTKKLQIIDVLNGIYKLRFGDKTEATKKEVVNETTMDIKKMLDELRTKDGTQVKNNDEVTGVLPPLGPPRAGGNVGRPVRAEAPVDEEKVEGQKGGVVSKKGTGWVV